MSGRRSGGGHLKAGFVLTIAIALAACSGNEPAGNEADNAANESPPIKLPPPIKKSASYRCKDNSVVSVDFLADDLTANLRTERGAFRLKAAKAGEAFRGDGQTLIAENSGITLTQAGKEPLHCKM
ncbi:hypothetical protein [Rhizorhapis sp. SPR117]|uniref:hypothetical protein n=1 Tax=Rhizorhapis sp. SPR117 TaxID=2912611 RepID=UPI001F1C930E|nr:hypothetical protein [Rhizorhapis sp. SPR117]